MPSHYHPVLSPELSSKLTALKAGLGHQRSNEKLAEVLVELSALSPDLVVRVSREIAVAAGMLWWQTHTRPLQLVVASRFRRVWWQLKQLFKGPSPTVSSDIDLLRNHHDYAWLFLFHPNGYVRQAALDCINSPPTSAFFFSALAARLNDWVPEVRRAAELCAERVLLRTTPSVIADSALYLLDRRLAWGRWSTQPQILDQIFGQEDVVAALVTQLQTRSTGPLATCLRYVLQFPTVDDHLPSLAAAAVQPAVRAVAYQCLTTGKARWPVGFEWSWIDKVYGLRKRVPKLATREIRTIRPTVDLIREATHDRSPLVRRVAADALIAARAQFPDRETLIDRLSKDRSPAVRSRADFLRRHPPSVPA